MGLEFMAELKQRHMSVVSRTDAARRRNAGRAFAEHSYLIDGHGVYNSNSSIGLVVAGNHTVSQAAENVAAKCASKKTHEARLRERE